ncbi:uncharacterized protein LOC143849114 [Tasmannia lanceolata]|uniref:uncharacterized protein LOC143849114 n=1 Tax=Tasmannia lanceolata TaxID=3420 RepID=UPI00406484F9
MSVFGGDSWAREANQRKRRVDVLMLDQTNKVSSSYKKLCNGKYACLVCPNNPVLDSPLMLSMHSKGSHHLASESRLNERELRKQLEINKRIALSGDSTGAVSSRNSSHCFEPHIKPLIEHTRKATYEAIHNQTYELGVTSNSHNVNFRGGNGSFFDPSPHPSSKWRKEPSPSVKPDSNNNEKNIIMATEATVKMLAEQQVEVRERREKELKFIEAGWKRDCHGGWFKDENVEFDSDEEDPNVCLF